MRSASRRGFSLLELMIVVAILGIVILMLWSMLFSFSDSYAANTRSANIQETARRVMDSISGELRVSDMDTFLVTKHNGADRVDFRTPVGVAGSSLVYSTTIQYRWEPSPVDADEDGAKDDGMLVRIQDGKTLVLCHHVRQGGVVIVRTGNNVVVRLTFVSSDGKGHATETWVQTSITLRNRST